MFFPLSFKKFKRRVRSPFTLLKKLTNKRKQNKSKSKRTEQQSALDAVPADAVNLSTPASASLDSAICSPFPATPVSTFGRTAPIQVVEHEEHQLGQECGIDGNTAVETQPLTLTEPVVKELANDVITQEEVKANLVHIEDVELVVDTKRASEHDVSSEAVEQHVEEEVPQDTRSTPIVLVDEAEVGATLVSELLTIENVVPEPQVPANAENPEQDTQYAAQPQVDEVDANAKQIEEPAATKDAVRKPQSVGSMEDVIQQDTQVTPQVQLDEVEVETKQVVEPPAIDSTVQEPHVDPAVKQDVQLTLQVRVEVEAQAEGKQVAETSSVDNAVQAPQPTAEDTSQYLFLQTSPSQTSSPTAASGNMLTPPTTPRKRVTSNMSSNTDADIMAELQASVRSREKKRIERERAEKERKQRELDLIAKKAKEATEHGSLKIADPEEKDHVLREIRSWRKQREASLKASPEDVAKDAAYREAFSNGEIMAELRSAAQSRSMRGPCTDNLQEKRQLALEDLFATRLQAIHV